VGLGDPQVVAKTIDSLCVSFNGAFVLQISLNKVALGLWWRNGFVSLLSADLAAHKRPPFLVEIVYSGLCPGITRGKRDQRT